MFTVRKIPLVLILLFVLLSAPFSNAGVPTSAESIIPPSASKMVVTTLGILTNHRPYQGATPLGNPGVDLGLEASLVHLPSDFGSALSDAGMSGGGSMSGGSLPMAKLHFHKGMGPSADIGFSGLWYVGNYIWGANLKFILSNPEEGLTVAFRMSYSSTNIDLSKLGFSGVTVKDEDTGIELGKANLRLHTSTWTPCFLVSRRLDFAEPYLGAQAELTSGSLEMPVTFSIPLPDQTFETASQGTTQLFLFTGVSFRPPNTGLRIALEGGYGHLGMHALGLWVGFGF